MTITPIRAVAQPAETILPASMVERVTLILDLFDSPYERLALDDIVRATGLPRSTAHRILEQLISLDWLSHTRFGYGLGRRATRLVGVGSDHTPLRAAAAPLLHALALRSGLVVHLAVLEHDEVLYLDKVGGRGASTIASRVGGRAPAHCTALGKAMLAWLDPEHIDATMRGPLPRRTDRSIDSLEVLHGQLAVVRRRNGVAFERGECVAGVDCVAVAVRDESGPVGALSLVASDGAPLERFAPLLIDAARRVTADLFGLRASAGRVRRLPNEPRWASSAALAEGTG